MLRPSYAPRFKKDYKRIARSGRKIVDLDETISMIIREIPLPACYSDHPLRGNLAGYRECHVEFDLLLMYQTYQDEVIFARAGTHSDLYD